MFPIRIGLNQGDVLSPLLFYFVVEYAIRRVQVNQDGFKSNGAHQLLVYVDDVNILGGSVYTINENAKALIVASKENGLELNDGRHRRRWEDNITMDLQELECGGMAWIELA